MFDIIKYIQPTWYFNLKPKVDHGYFPVCSSSEYDDLFSTNAQQEEAAYKAHQNGTITKDAVSGVDWWYLKNQNLNDEYRIARKYFHPSRVFFAYTLRLLTFHNPFKETSAFIRSRNIHKFNFQSVSDPEGYAAFNSELLNSSPKITVIIPTLNRYEYLSDVLKDLEAQDYNNFDVIVVDQSTPFRPDFYSGNGLKIKVIHQTERALWLARNTAIEASDSEYLLFYDDDSRIEKNWISEHIKCLDYFNASISSGVSLSKSGGSIPVNYSFFKYSDQLDTGNALIKREVFRKVGLFDRQFEKQRMGDGEFGLRAYLEGFKNISNYKARRLHLKVGEGGLREMGSWDAFRPKSFWSPRPIPSVLYMYRKYFGIKAAVISLLLNVPPSIVPYRFKKNKPMLIAGSVISVFLIPFILIQVYRSWLKSSKMLNESAIEPLIK